MSPEQLYAKIFGGGSKLLQESGRSAAIAAQQAGVGVQAAEQQSLADIVDRAQKQGVRFGGFDPAEYNRLFGVTAAPAKATLAPEQVNLALAQAMNELALGGGKATASTGEQIADLAQQERITVADLASEEQRSAARNRADIEAARIKEARSQAESKELDPEDEAELEAQVFVQAAIENPDTVQPGYREKVLEYLAKKYRGTIKGSKIRNLVYNDYFPDEWESLYGVR